MPQRDKTGFSWGTACIKILTVLVGNIKKRTKAGVVGNTDER
jgi:hypothetical protein